MDLIQAYRMVRCTLTYLQQNIQRFSKCVKEVASTFITWAEDELEKVDYNEVLEFEFPEKIRRRVEKCIKKQLKAIV